MLSSNEPARVNEMKKQQLLKGTLKKMDQAEIIARGLGLGSHEVSRLREEGLLELKRQIFS